MAAIAVQTHLTPEEYLAWERKAPYKNEYLSGQILAMSGASRAHNLVTGNIFNGLYNQLVNRDCEVYTGEMLVKANPVASYFYPDVTVVCDEPRFEDDRGEKFESYKQIASLQEYVLVSQDKVHVEHYFRLGTQWRTIEFQDIADVLPLVSIRCELPLSHIYRRVQWTDTP